ncbi:T9SS type A sorting domain-containing protein, partial [Lentimicrobium sp. S6]|uniref:T9SS type A sorting domain-containing protein n=1 Tax=Lentimicrobium sp. S6 TaxID=2735872 RepID=UPI0015527F60
TILNQKDTAIITWNPTYEGQVNLKTGILNKCDIEEFSNEKEVRVRTCLGAEKQKGYYLEVYPNPASEWVTFDYKILSVKDAELTIKSIDGKQVAQFNLTGETGQKVWDTRSLKAGAYNYEFISGEL